MKLTQTTLILLSSLAVPFFGGCGSKTPPPANTTTETASPNPAPAATPASTTGNSATNAPAAPATVTNSGTTNSGGKETKWIGTIPYDVFYDQPLTIASDSSVIATPNGNVGGNTMATTTASPTASPSTEPASSSSPPAAMSASDKPAATGNAAGQADWRQVIPMPILLEQSKVLRTRLTGNLQTVATFNKATKDISIDAAILASLAAVASIHPESAPWKENAHFVRDLAAEISASADGTGRAPFTKCKEPFEKLTIVMDGGKPPEMDSPVTMPFAEAVYVADMMKWIEPSFNGLKANFNTAARLKEDPALVERELRILAMLGTMMADSSYDSADEEGYQKLMRRFIDGANEAILAAKTGDVETYQAALNKIQTTCAECHQEYRGSSSAF